MRRPVLALASALALMLTMAPPASAVGPGSWDHVGNGGTSTTYSLNGAVYALNTSNPGVLYAGGNFTSAGGHTNAQRIARWNGSAWGAIGATPLTNGAVFAIAYHAGNVYVGGTFQNAGGNADLDFLAVWDGSTWASPCTSTAPGHAISGNVNALQIVGNTLYVGGSFANGAAMAAADYLLACDLTTGAASSTVSNDGDFGGAVYALTADSAGTLYAGGGFINLDGILAADHIAAYDGSWHAMGSGPSSGTGAVDSFVRALTASGSNVYVGTDSVDVAGIANADHVARWNGSTWSAVGANTAGTNGWFPATSFIYGLTTYGSLIFATGSFQNANGIATADDIAYFDGGHWQPLGSNGAGDGPFVANGLALGVTLGKVFLGGNFTSAGGDTLARFLAAYALRLPDAMIGGTSTGPFAGNNIYSTSGAGEIRNVTITRGHSAALYVKIQNDGLVPASFKVKGTGGATGISAAYYRGTTNITSAVRAGSYATGTITARASIVLRVVVSVAPTSSAGSTLATTALSTTGNPPDAVRIVVKAG